MLSQPDPILLLILDLARVGAALRRAGDSLLVNAPPGVLTEDLKARVRIYKAPLLALVDGTFDRRDHQPLLDRADTR